MKKIFTLLICLIFSNVSVALERYVVQQDDSLASILKAKNYGATYEQILPFVNEIILLNPTVLSSLSPDRIFPGTTIQLPENPNQPKPEVTPEPDVESIPESAHESAPELVITDTEAIAEPDPVPEAASEAVIETEPLADAATQPIPEAEPIAKPIIGSISAEKGETDILREGQLLRVNKQQSLLEDDTIITKQNSIAIVHLNDQTTFKLGPGSSLTINQFNYADDKDNIAEPSGSLIATISGGVVRTITGLLGKLRSNDYEILSSLSIAIGIRGTDFTVRDCTDKALCGDLYGVSVAVQEGSISVKNEAAEIVLHQNEFSHIQSATETPRVGAIPENFFDLEANMNEIVIEKSFWQKLVAWLSSLF